MFRAAQPANPFANTEDCCERCLSTCHTTEEHASESLENPFTDPSEGLQRVDSGLEISNTSIKANERRILTRFATNQATEADCDYVLKTLCHSAYQAGYAKGKRHSCKRDYTEGYSDGFNSARDGNDQGGIDQAFKLERDYGFGEGACKRLQLQRLNTSFDQSREDEEFNKNMRREGFVRRPGGGWAMVETTLREDLKEEWKNFKRVFKSRKPKAVRKGNEEGKWQKLMGFDGVDEAGPKSKEKFGARLRTVKANSDASTNFKASCWLWMVERVYKMGSAAFQGREISCQSYW